MFQFISWNRTTQCVIYLILYCSDEDNTTNPKVTVDQDDLDFEGTPPAEKPIGTLSLEDHKTFVSRPDNEEDSLSTYMRQMSLSKDSDDTSLSRVSMLESSHNLQLSLDNDFPLWAGDTSARRSPEGIYFPTDKHIHTFLLKVNVIFPTIF